MSDSSEQNSGSVDEEGIPIRNIENDSSESQERSSSNENSENEEKPEDKFAEPGRVRRFATIMNMLNSLLGAGILSVPASLKAAGIIPSLTLLVIMALLSHIATVLTMKLQNRVKAEGLDDLALKITGSVGSFILSILSMLYCISTMTCYLVIGGDMLMSWFRLVKFDVKPVWPRALLILIYALVIPVALTIPKEIKVLSYFSFITVFCILLFFFVIIIKACIEIPKNGLAKNLIYSKLGMGLFTALSVYGLAFALPVVALPILAPYNKNDHKRSVVSGWTCGLCFILVIVPGILGYIMLGDQCKDNILNSFPDLDTLIIIVRIGFFLVVSFSYPCLGQALIASWCQVLFKENDQKKVTKCQRVIVLICTSVIPIGIAMFLPNVGPAISVAGAMGGCAVDFVYPPVMWIIMSKKKWTHWQNLLCVLFAIFGVIAGALSTYQAVVDAIKSFK